MLKLKFVKEAQAISFQSTGALVGMKVSTVFTFLVTLMVYILWSDFFLYIFASGTSNQTCN